MSRPPVVERCRELLRLDTQNPGSTEEAAVRHVADVLAAAGVESEVVEPEPGRASLVARHRGGEPGLPALVVHCHLDVVPPGEGWSRDPFGAEEADGCLWGRGAVDMKGFAAMMLVLQERLGRGEARPRRDLVFAYFADEEMGGSLGSGWLVEHRPDLFAGAREALGELGGFGVTLPDGRRLYPVAVAEKGMLWLRLVVPGRAGHAAFASGPLSPVVRMGELAGRIARLATDDPTPPAFEACVARLRALVGETEAGIEELLASLGGFGAVVGHGRATSFVPTLAAAGSKLNVVPARAELGVDCRFVPGGEERARAAVASVLDDDVRLEVVGRRPGTSFDPEGPLVRACARTVAELDPDAEVVPYVLPGFTDAQSLASLGIAGYGFTPLPLPPGFDYTALFHGVDERVPVESLVRGAEMLERLVLAY